MDFTLDPTASKETSLVATTFQTAGTLLIAVLLRLLTPSTPGRFLRYWSLAWSALAAALVSLSLSFVLAPLVGPEVVPWVRRPALAAYCVFEYTFGFYLWAGCRAYAHGTLLRRSDLRLLVAPAAFGLAIPAFVPNIHIVFPFHAVVFGGFCLLAMWTTRGCRPAARPTVVGLRMTQFALVAITLLFWHYVVVMAWAASRTTPPDLSYLHYSAMYDALSETLLAFGMVVLATDAVRREWEGKNRELIETNRKLAEASEQLAVVARTDPLTGLLNRRAFDAMLAERAGGPFAGSVAVVDLNFLKQINDTSGHAAGDAAILHVARALRTHFRITDPIFRFGGDEFLVLLEGSRAADLSYRLEAVDTALRGLRLPGVTEPTDVVIAWGMADFETADGLTAAVAHADLAMYQCKARRKTPVAPV
jgi:diguanylate cyclase (GGDEF)-like protein